MTAQRDDACDGTDAGLGCVCGQPDNHRAAGQDYPMLRAVATSPIYPLVSCYSAAGKRLHHEAKSFLSALAARDEEIERLQETLSTLGVEFVEDAGPQAFWRNTRAENAEHELRQAEAERDALKERLARLQDTHREEHLRAEQALAERDALKRRVADLERERDGARAERNGIISRLRLKWPHIEIGERGKRRDPGPPTCLRCSIEDMIGEPYHDGLGPPRGESAAAQDPEPPDHE